MQSTTIRTENLSTLASKADIQDLITAIIRIEKLVMENNAKPARIAFSLLPFIWKYLPIAHMALHFLTIFLVSSAL